MAIENQGYIRNLDLSETTNAALALANLAGSSIPDDLRIIQNNLRNTSKIGYSTFSQTHFQFPELDFVFTNNDIIQVTENVSIGSTILNKNLKYFICSSDGISKFKLSTTSEAVGFTTFDVFSVDKDNFDFVRSDEVTQENLKNLIDPANLRIDDTAEGDANAGDSANDDDTGFLSSNNRFGSGSQRIRNALELTQDIIETANFSIGKKYTTNGNVSTSEILRYEGILKSSDPVNLNATVQGLQNSSSPGFYIGTVRAFSSDSNPWEKDTGTGELVTTSTSVKVNELFFHDELRIGGINVTSATTTDPNDFTHKLPIEIYGEIYYLLLKQ